MKKNSTNKKGNNKTTKKNNVKKTSTESMNVEKQLNEKINENGEMKRLLKIVLIVTAIFAIFYGITIVVTNTADDAKRKQKVENKTVEKSDIQYEYIMIGTMLNYNGTYYVLVEDADDSRLDEYKSLITSINAKEDAPTIYKANLTDSFNKSYLAKEENYSVDDISDFAVTGTTLVKVVDGKIDSVMDNYEKIRNALKDLS